MRKLCATASFDRRPAEPSHRLNTIPAFDKDSCLNCETQLEGEFCHECGQRVQPLKVSFFKLVGGWLRETFEADGRLPRTVLPLFFSPGQVPRAYLAGRRTRFTSPLKMYLFTAIVCFLAFGALTEKSFRAQFDALPAADEAEIDAALKEGTSDFWQDRVARLQKLGAREAVNRLTEKFFGYAPTVLTLLLPFAAFLLWILFRRTYYAEHLVFVLYQQSVLLVLFAIAVLFQREWVALAGLGAGALHYLLALRTTFQRSWRWTTFAFLASSTGYGLLLLAGFVATVFAALAWS